tara:strand:+ start:91 stop:543 length:453 start_codon:yes stop_codon:yes gene_type:complete
MIRENIQKEVVASMKGGNKQRTAALRLIQAKIKDRDIEQRTAKGDVDDDELVTDVLLKMAKQRKESIAMYREGGRDELAEKEEYELSVIEEFLPKQMDEAETKAAIEQVKADIGASDIKAMGKVMAELKARHGATLDMTRTSGWVKESLS